MISLKMSLYCFCFVLFTGIVLFCVDRIYSDTYVWYNDGGVYLQIAKNIYNSRPISDLLGSSTFPFGYPLILVFWAKLFSWNISSFKYLNFLFLTINAGAIALFSRQVIGYIHSLLLAMIVVTNFVTLQWTGSIESDVMYCAIVALVLWICDIIIRAIDNQKKFVLYSGLAIFLASYGLTVRTSSIALSIALCVLFLSIIISPGSTNHKNKRIFASILFVISTSTMILVYFFVERNRIWFAQYTIDTFNNIIVQDGWHGLVRILMDRAKNETNYFILTVFNFDRFPEIVVYTLFVMMLLCFLYSCVFMRRMGLVIFSFVFVSASLVLLLPFTGHYRYHMPTYPIILFCVSCYFVSYKVSYKIRLISRSLAYAFFIIILSFNIYKLKDLRDLGERDEPLLSAAQWLEGNTDPNERFCSFLRNDFSYLTNRTVCGVDPVYSLARLRSGVTGDVLLREYGAVYLVLPRKPPHAIKYNDLLMRLYTAPGLQTFVETDDYVIFGASDRK